MNQLALEVLSHAVAFSGQEQALALARARRVLYVEGLEGILRGAPEDLLRRVATTIPQEQLLLALFEALREPTRTADPAKPHPIHFETAQGFLFPL